MCVYIYAHTQSFTQILQHSSEGLVGFLRVFCCTKVKMNVKCMSTRKSLLKYSLLFCIDALNIQLHRKIITKYESLPFHV